MNFGGESTRFLVIVSYKWSRLKDNQQNRMRTDVGQSGDCYSCKRKLRSQQPLRPLRLPSLQGHFKFFRALLLRINATLLGETGEGTERATDMCGTRMSVDWMEPNRTRIHYDLTVGMGCVHYQFIVEV